MAQALKMSPERFLELFMEELKTREDMYHYYKFLEDPKKVDFRKNYFLERLRYVLAAVQGDGQKIFDCGCGYGTTALFLAMNDIPVHGTTLEYYSKDLDKRYAFWSKFGNANLFTCSHENLFDSPPERESYDQIIIQDTLHHLEPIDDALAILYNSLKPGGEIIAIEENGSNVIQNLKLYKQRGNKRIIKVWDENLGKEFLMGNENIRSIEEWTNLMKPHGFTIDEDRIQYVRYFLPHKYNGTNGEELLQKERQLQKKKSLRRKFLFFGINFIAKK